MKLAILLVALLGASARADTPNSPALDDDVDLTTADFPQAGPRARPGRPGRGVPARIAKRRQLRAALMAAFDLDGDGRLGPRERQHALRVLRRLERRLATGSGAGAMGPRGMGPRGRSPAAHGPDEMERPGADLDRRARRANRMRRFIERHDTNHDGDVGPNEVPRGAADRLRRFDRNGDGWVEPGELGLDR